MHSTIVENESNLQDLKENRRLFTSQHSEMYPFFGSMLFWGFLLVFTMRTGVESAYICLLSIVPPLLMWTVASFIESSLSIELSSECHG